MGINGAVYEFLILWLLNIYTTALNETITSVSNLWCVRNICESKRNKQSNIFNITLFPTFITEKSQKCIIHTSESLLITVFTKQDCLLKFEIVIIVVVCVTIPFYNILFIYSLIDDFSIFYLQSSM